jgi:hypothetical protein
MEKEMNVFNGNSFINSQAFSMILLEKKRFNIAKNVIFHRLSK